MRSKAILKELIEMLDRFETENPQAGEPTMADFVGFLNSQVGFGDKMGLSSRDTGGDEAPWLSDVGEEPSTTIARLVTLMNRYARTYIKRALEGSPLQTGDEFSYLIVLLTYKSLTKTDLIQKHIMEKTSGTEVIKRLIKLEMITEFDDEDDKRSKRIAITEKGKMTLYSLLPKMHSVTTLVAGNLTAPERLTLAYLLKKLDEFHHPIYVHDKGSGFEDLKEKYMTDSSLPTFPPARPDEGATFL